MNDRTGQIWHVESATGYQVFVVLDVASEYATEYATGFFHPRLILCSNREIWDGRVAPYPEEKIVPWETLDHFKRIT